MSREKTLQEYVEDLTIELDNLNKKRDLIQIALTLAQERLPFFHKKEDAVEHNEQRQDFVHMSIVDACYQVLREQDKPCSSKEIALALKKRGIKSKSVNFTSNVASILSRKEDIVKVEYGLWKLKK